MTAEAPRSGAGSVQEETARLIESLLGNADRAGAAGTEPGDEETTTGSPGERDAADGTAHASQECRYCPLCRGMSALYAIDPAILERLAAVADLAADGLRSAATHLAAARAERTNTERTNTEHAAGEQPADPGRRPSTDAGADAAADEREPGP